MTSIVQATRKEVRAPRSSPKGPSRRRIASDVVGILAVCAIVLIGYFEVPFAGKTFSTAPIVDAVSVVIPVEGRDIVGCGTPSGVCAKASRNDPRFDPVASAQALDPWGPVAHRALAAGDLPLWNPYQGIGAPLAGNMQSAAFDPLMLPYHLHPTPLLQDLTFLMGLLLAAVGAYGAVRVIGLSPLAATVTGSVFGLSGWFFVYGNNHWFRTYLYLPLIVLSIEWLLRTRRHTPIVLLGASAAGMVLVGMPEPTFMAFVAVGFFALLRLVAGPRVDVRPRAALRLAAGAGLGLLLCAPVVLLFREYLPLSNNVHKGLSSYPPITDPIYNFLTWMMPKIRGLPAERNWTWASGRAYAGTRNWVGAGALLLAAGASASPRAMRRYAAWPLAAMGALLAFQIYGGSLVAWTRYIPFWSQALWPNFGTPIIAFALAVLAGVGVQAISDGELRAARLLVAFAVLLLVAVILVLRAPYDVNLGHGVSALGGWPLAAAAAAAAVGAVFLLRRRSAALAVGVIIVMEIVLLAPRGFYAERANPYPDRSWIEFVSGATANDTSRVFSTDAVLYPNTASAYGLGDLRTVDALYVNRYWRYLRTFISRRISDRFTASGYTQDAANLAGNSMFDLLGVKYVLFKKGSGNAPPSWSDPQYRPAFEGGGIRVYENTHAAPRAFVVHDVHQVSDAAGALRFLTRGEPNRFPNGSVMVTNKDPRTTAVIESKTTRRPGQSACPPGASNAAQITDHTTTSVTVQVDATCPGLLVLSDAYYPGWEARVNGRSSTVYPTDLALRGVEVPKGKSTVVFHYRPATFRFGVGLAAAAGAVIIAVALGALSLPRLSSRRRRPAPASDHETGTVDGPSIGGAEP